MTRAAATGDVVTVKPSPNIYTVLLAASTIATLLGLIAVIVRYNSVFGEMIWK
jgi:hypothetical protein